MTGTSRSTPARMIVRTPVIEEHTIQLVRPLVTAAGRVEKREIALLRLNDDADHTGVGEAAPLPGFSEETRAVAVAALQALFHVQRVQELPGNVATLRDFMGTQQHLPPSAAHALEQALLDLIAQRAGTTLIALLTDRAPRQTIPVHRLVSTAEQAAAAVADGARALKIKVGVEPLDYEDAKLGAIRRRVGNDVTLRLDANGAWTAESACAALERLAAHTIESIEQPVPADDISGLATVRNVTNVKILADESCRTLADLQRLIDANACDGIVLKPMLAGGILASFDMLQRAADAGLAVSVTSSLDSAIARAAATQLAAIAPGELLTCGLDTGRMLTRDLADVPRANGSELPVPARAERIRPRELPFTGMHQHAARIAILATLLRIVGLLVLLALGLFVVSPWLLALVAIGRESAVLQFVAVVVGAWVLLRLIFSRSLRWRIADFLVVRHTIERQRFANAREEVLP